MTGVAELFDDLSKIAGVCPVCERLFRLNDARPYRRSPPLRSVLDDIEDAQARIDRAIERLEDIEHQLRKRARTEGLAQTKRRLKQVDQVFARMRLDAHDVKVVFDPIDFIVFDGASKGRLRRLVLLAQEPISSAAETIWWSLERVVDRGNYDFKTMRISNDGICSLS